MKILFLTSRLPYPPNRGDRVRTFNFVRQMSHEHEVSVLSFIADPSENAFVEPLQQYCARVQTVLLRPHQSCFNAGRGLFSSKPLQVHYYHSRTFAGKVQREIELFRPDMLYVHLFRMAPYGMDMPVPYRVLDMTDVISREIELSLPYRNSIQKRVYALEYERIRRYETEIINHFDESWLISPQDLAQLNGRRNGAKVTVVPNGVNTELFRPLSQPREPRTLIFVGHMGVPHNHDAADRLIRQVVPRVEAACGPVQVRLVGQDSDRNGFRNSLDGRVQCTGFVEDLNGELNRSAVFAAPLRFAAGTQNKILEAMAAGTPVVTTSLGNQGIGASPDSDLLVGDTDEQFANHVVRALQDQPTADSMGLRGRQFVETRFPWSAVQHRLQDIANSI
jgi:polysaccharide biosynthesis protein PslH